VGLAPDQPTDYPTQRSEPHTTVAWLTHHSGLTDTPQRGDSHAWLTDWLSHESSSPFTGDGSPRPLC